MKKRLWIPILIVVLAVAGYFGYLQIQSAQAAQQSIYQTEPASRGELIARVGATGTVRPNQDTSLVWQTSGIIERVEVELDQTVQAGDILAVLESTSLPQSVILAQADLVEAQRALENLRDSEVAKANAQQALVVAQKAFNDAQRVRDNKDRGRASQETIDSAYAGYILAQDKVDILQGIFNNMSNLEEDNPSRANALANLANAKKERDKALVNLNWYKGEPNEQEIAEADASLAVATANLADAQREWDRLKNGPDPDDIKAAEARIAAIQATLDTAQITAPFSGTITDINAKPGDMVSMATPAFSLDDLTRLLVDVPVTEVDVNRIRTGQEVSLTFDAIPSKNYTGMTTHVSRVGVEEQGVVTFVVTVELTDPDELVRPGMTAAVNIVSTQLEDVLLVPNRAVRLLEGERVVYVLRNGVPEPVQVQLGASSDAYSQVVESSLKEGDLIVLNPPSQFQGGPGFGMGG